MRRTHLRSGFLERVGTVVVARANVICKQPLYFQLAVPHVRRWSVVIPTSEDDRPLIPQQ